MPRIPVPFVIEAETDERRPQHQLRVTLSGDMKDVRRCREDLRVLQERILQIGYKIVIVNAEDLRPASEGAQLWFDFANALPGTVQIIYCDSHLSAIVEYDDEYRPGHVNDVHIVLNGA